MSSQQASWETNAYVVATTRVFVVFGLAYMAKNSYQLYRRLRASNGGTVIQDRSKSHSSFLSMTWRPCADRMPSDRSRRSEHWFRTCAQWLLLRTDSRVRSRGYH